MINGNIVLDGIIIQNLGNCFHCGNNSSMLLTNSISLMVAVGYAVVWLAYVGVIHSDDDDDYG